MKFLNSHKHFLSRLLCLLMILCALGIYQSHAKIWAAEVEENEERIAEVEAWNREVLAEEDRGAGYVDGTYEGSGTGYGGTIRVEVVVEHGSIQAINVLEADNEDEAYFTIAKMILDPMIRNQSADVDIIAGATMSSTGLKNAVAEALEQAVDA